MERKWIVLQMVRQRLILLHHILTRRRINKLKQIDPNFEKIFSFTPTEISHVLSIPLKKAMIIEKQLHNAHLIQKTNAYQQSAEIITIYDEHYPKLLKFIHDTPLVLYALGDMSLLNHFPSISVIGTRNPSTEAYAKLRHIVTPLIKEDWLIVSGLAYGIDSLAHKLTLNYDGKTISVLGSGFNHIYPQQNIPLFNHIARSGLVLTEYPPDVRPKRYHFPERNRIISGLTGATLVIEATEKSGTLITVDQALEQGREVYAVPGSPLITQTVGCHKMIQDGAKLVMSAEDIMEDWQIDNTMNK